MTTYKKRPTNLRFTLNGRDKIVFVSQGGRRTDFWVAVGGKWDRVPKKECKIK